MHINPKHMSNKRSATVNKRGRERSGSFNGSGKKYASVTHGFKGGGGTGFGYVGSQMGGRVK